MLWFQKTCRISEPPSILVEVFLYICYAKKTLMREAMSKNYTFASWWCVRNQTSNMTFFILDFSSKLNTMPPCAQKNPSCTNFSKKKNFKHTLLSIIKGTIVMAHQKNEHTLHTVHFLSNLLRQHELNLIFLGISGHNDNPRLKLELHMNAFFCLYFSRILCILSNMMKRHWFNIKGFPWLFKAPLMKIGKITRC